jgi:hypothetical protein
LNRAVNAKKRYLSAALRAETEEYLSQIGGFTDHKAYKDKVLPYWERFGYKPDEFWFEFSGSRDQVMDPGFMPLDLLYNEIVPYLNNMQFRTAITDKAYYDVWFPDVKQAVTVCRRVAGIYYDGGMDIISGSAEILGINMPLNFERPYFSRSIAEYWRRWHITLGTWFRDYVFYPLSISRASQALSKRCRKRFGPGLGKMLPTYLAMVLVWLLNGIWHGAGAQFVVFGMYQGILIVLGMQLEPVFQWIIDKFRIRTDCFSWRLWQMLRTLALIMGGRIIFKASGLYEAMRIGWSILKIHNIWIFTDGTLFKLGLNAWELFLLFVAVLVLLTVSILQEKGYHIREAIERQNLVFRWLLYIAAIATVILFGVYGPSYDAAGFVYAGF